MRQLNKDFMKESGGYTILEFPSGDYVFVGFHYGDEEDGSKDILYAGDVTNCGVTHTYEVPYDWCGNSNSVDDRDILDANIQHLYETIVQLHPEYLEPNEVF